MVAGDKHGVCRLCLSSDKPLCRSHVVPEFCYEYEQQGDHRHAFAMHLRDSGRLRKKTVQKGHREYLLCPECEQRLSCHERIFAEYWKPKIKLAGPFTQDQHIILEGANYRAMKLFLLSVFWRCSISQTFGKGIRLGPYAEKLRTILLNDQFVPQQHYPVLCSIILDPDGNPFIGYVDNPYGIRIEAVRSYRMAFGGCMWTLVMSDHGVPKKLESLEHVLSESGDLHLLVKSYRSFPSIRQIGRAIQKSENTRVPGTSC